jgi:hypothetical protein
MLFSEEVRYFWICSVSADQIIRVVDEERYLRISVQAQL